MTTFTAELSSPYEIDTHLNLVNKLLSNGNAVFISDDNLATVVNVVTGVAGTSADITNNERGVASGDYRVGYALVGMSVDEQASLNADPYQIFHTTQDENLDYCFRFDGVSQYLEIPNLSSSVQNFSLKIKYDGVTYQNHNAQLFDFSGFGSGFYIFMSQATRLFSLSSGGGGFTDAGNGQPVPNDIGLPSGFTGTLEFVYTASTKNVKIYIDDVLSAEGIGQGTLPSFDTTSTTFNVPSHARTTNVTKNSIVEIVIIDFDNSSNSRYYDFNRTAGAVVPDLLNGQDGTLVNAPVDSGYMIENGEIIGYKFRGDGHYAGTFSTFNVRGDGVVDKLSRIVFDITHDDVNNNHLLGEVGHNANWNLLYPNGTMNIRGSSTSGTGTAYSTSAVVPPELIGKRITLEFIHDVKPNGVSTTTINVYAPNSDVVAGTHYHEWDSWGLLPNEYVAFSAKRLTQTPSYFHSVQFFVDNTLERNYDFTTGDIDEIPDTVGGYNAPLNATKTSGWMPIVDTQTFLIHPTTGDYVSPQAMLDTEQLKSYFVRGLVSDGVYVDTIDVGAQSFTNNFLLQALNEHQVELQVNLLVGGEFGHKLHGGWFDGFVFTGHETSSDAPVFIDSANNPLHPLVVTNSIITNRRLTGASQQAIQMTSEGATNNTYTFKNCQILSEVPNTSVGILASGSANGNTLSFLDCVIVHNDVGATNTTGVVRANTQKIDMINCVVYSAAAGLKCLHEDTVGNLTFQNVVTNDGTGDIPNVDFTLNGGAFVDG